MHRNILCKFTGQAVELFDEEFRHLYASSKPLMGLKSPRLAAPLQPRAVSGTPNGRLSSNSCSASDHTSSNLSSPSVGSNPPDQRLSTSSGPGSPLGPNPAQPPRYQAYHNPWGAPAAQALFSPRTPNGPPTPYSNPNAYRPTRLQLEQLGLLPRATHIWRPFLQASPPF